MKKIELRPNGTKRVYTVNEEPSLTDGSQLQDTDVNVIMNRVLKTRDESILKQRQGQYADVSQIPNLGEAMMQVKEAEDAFSSLPASIRRRFGNSPVEMVSFLQDPQNDPEAIRLGLKNHKPVPPPVVDAPIPPSTP